MKEQVYLALGYVRAVWRRRRRVLLVTWVVCALAWVAILFIPPKYGASATVYVEALTPLRPVLKGIAIDEETYDSSINIVREALLTRPNLEAVARQTGLDVDVKTPADRDWLMQNLRDTIEVKSINASPAGQSRDLVYSIAYQNKDRDRSINVVKSLLQDFEEGTIKGGKQGTSEAQDFLVKQISELAQRLSTSEARLADFKKKNSGLLPGERGDYFSRLSRATDELQQARTNLAIAISRREALQRQMQDANPYLPGSSDSGAARTPGAIASDLSTRVQEAEARLADMLLRFTDKHPEVIALRENIRQLKAAEAQELADLQKGGKGTGAIRSLASNPVYQQLQLQINQVAVEIASLRGAISQHEGEIASMRQYVDLAPEVEQELASLTRDYGVTKTQYETLMQRLEQAKLADEAAQSGTIRFRVIDPPRADVMPVWPNRGLLFIIALIGAVLIGIAESLIRNLLAPTFDDTNTLEKTTGMRVLGTVSRTRSQAQIDAVRLHDRKLLWMGAALLATAAILIGFGEWGALAIHRMIG